MALPVQRCFDDLGVPLAEVPFCVLDIETTGGSPAGCGITEIGALRFRGGELDGTFHTLVNPHQEIPAFITVLTGITQAMVIEAPPIEQALPALIEFIGEAVVVGHNVRFDLSFLNAAAERLGYGRLANRSVDTYALARRLVRSELRDLRLGTLAAFFGSPTTPNHRALEDARATAFVLWGLLERAGTLGITHLEDLLQLPTARGAAHYGKIRLADSLPRRPGRVPVPRPGRRGLLRGQGGQPAHPGAGLLLRRRSPPGRPDAARVGDHRPPGLPHRPGGRGGGSAPHPRPQPPPQPSLPAGAGPPLAAPHQRGVPAAGPGSLRSAR